METDSRTTSVHLVIRASDESDVRELLQDAEVPVGESRKFEPPPENREDYPDPAFSPLIVLVAAFTIAYLARVVFRLWRQANIVGVIIDVRGPELKVQINESLEAGHVIVIGNVAAKEFVPKNEDELAEILVRILDKK